MHPFLHRFVVHLCTEVSLASNVHISAHHEQGTAVNVSLERHKQQLMVILASQLAFDVGDLAAEGTPEVCLHGTQGPNRYTVIFTTDRDRTWWPNR